MVAGGDERGSRLNELNKPLAIALDSARNLYIVDSDNIRVMKYKLNATVGEIVLGHGSNRYPRFTGPIYGLLIDKTDRLYTYSKDSHLQNEIIRWSSDSVNGTLLFTPYTRIYALAIGTDFNIYIASEHEIDIYMAPTYISSRMRKIFGFPVISLKIACGSSIIYLAENDHLFGIEFNEHQVRGMVGYQENSTTLLPKPSFVTAITFDCHNNLYSVDIDATLTIYNSSGSIISTMRNALDNPLESSSWPLLGYVQGGAEYLPDYFSSIVLDPTNGDLYVIMWGYHRVTKFTLS